MFFFSILLAHDINCLFTNIYKHFILLAHDINCLFTNIHLHLHLHSLLNNFKYYISLNSLVYDLLRTLKYSVQKMWYLQVCVWSIFTERYFQNWRCPWHWRHCNWAGGPWPLCPAGPLSTAREWRSGPSLLQGSTSTDSTGTIVSTKAMMSRSEI